MNNKSNFLVALKWITDKLIELDIPYQIVGGLAAKCYGSTRPLHDIDFYIPGKYITILENELTEYIEAPPEHLNDENWDILFMKLRYNGQQIEFADADTARYYDSRSQLWIKQEINFTESTLIEFEGIELPVIPKQDLIQYKKRLDRKVDRIDIMEIQKQD